MAELGAIHTQCPACEAPIVLPLTQTGADLTSVTLAIDLGAVRTHIATQHPQEPAMSAITDKFRDLVIKLEDEGHQLADDARTLFSHYEKEATAVVGAVGPILSDLRAGIAADVTDAVARVEAAVAKVEALVKQPPAGS